MGEGFPLVLVPGLQGHWQWMRPGIEALARDWQVVCESLDENDVFHSLDRAIHAAGLDDRPIVLVGVSFGGLVAADYSARHPDRIAALVLASAPAPNANRDGRVADYLAHPKASASRYLLRGAARIIREVIRSRPFPSSLWLMATLTARTIRWPIDPNHAAGWIRQWADSDLIERCGRITAPTLVLTGEPDLDEVVPTEGSLEYLRLIPGARAARLAGTGHIGIVSQSAAFARIVRDFATPYAHSSMPCTLN